jgi:hypothetical protein
VRSAASDAAWSKDVLIMEMARRFVCYTTTLYFVCTTSRFYLIKLSDEQIMNASLNANTSSLGFCSLRTLHIHAVLRTFHLRAVRRPPSPRYSDHQPESTTIISPPRTPLRIRLSFLEGLRWFVNAATCVTSSAVSFLIRHFARITPYHGPERYASGSLK